MTTRREFLASSPVLPFLFASAIAEGNSSGLITRGVVLLPEDLSLSDWPERAKRAGLNTIGIHHQNSPQAVVNWIKTDSGQQFLQKCARLELNVEYELHAMKELLPRSAFAKHPDWFRMTDKGERKADANCCVHSSEGLAVICENAIKLAKALHPTTDRFFYWGDDGQPWCNCPKCKELSPSDQALLLENQIIRALKREYRQAQLAHLAYANTFAAPSKIKPEPGIFLEFAPIQRRYDLPFDQQPRATALPGPPLAWSAPQAGQSSATSPSEGLAALDANLQVFPRDTAQILEYWLDASRFAKWRRPAQKIPWDQNVFLADVASYRKRGIRHITTFAAWIDADYQKRFTDLSFLDQYGAGLQQR